MRLIILPFKLAVNMQPDGTWYAYLEYGVYNEKGMLLKTLIYATIHYPDYMIEEMEELDELGATEIDENIWE